MPRNLALSRWDDEPRTKSGRRSRWDDDGPEPHRRTPKLEADDLGGPPEGARWSTWDDIGIPHGPAPHPDWVVQALGAIDYELGILKTGKEADVYLVERSVPDTEIGVLMAAKRYRGAEHRMFHRDAGYVEGRRVRESRMNRAMAKRTDFGRELLSGQWAYAEFELLGQLYTLGAPVPYPVQLDGTEILMEFIGGPDGTAAPRLAQYRGTPDELHDLYEQCVQAMCLLAAAGWAHGDLSAYNMLVHEGRLVVIDVPQALDIVANPRGAQFLRRDADNVCKWFSSHDVPADPADLTERLLDEARMLSPERCRSGRDRLGRMSTETYDASDGSDVSPDGPDDSDAAVQLGTEETLDGPLGTDPLDAGFSPNDRPVAIDDFGTTADEMAEGESLDARLAREQPDVPEIDEHRSGRLVEPDEGVREDGDAQLVATDVGVDGGAASAEEAAVHDVDEGQNYAGDGTDEAFGGGLADDVEAVTADVDDQLDTDPAGETDAAATDAAHDAETVADTDR